VLSLLFAGSIPTELWGVLIAVDLLLKILREAR
jgi:hypothetical protein